MRAILLDNGGMNQTSSEHQTAKDARSWMKLCDIRHTFLDFGDRASLS